MKMHQRVALPIISKRHAVVGTINTCRVEPPHIDANIFGCIRIDSQIQELPLNIFTEPREVIKKLLQRVAITLSFHITIVSCYSCGLIDIWPQRTAARHDNFRLLQEIVNIRV
ncbi:MAG: hypothetical protein EBX49_03835 [Synechococcaceae bacterium WB8_1B_136]|nr:hypothetical protein [Synechococcaceae bacterium WB8_1B_136]